MILDDVQAVIYRDNPFREVDLKGKRWVKCPYCGEDFPITPREVSEETRQHLKNVERLYTQTKGMGVPIIINFRWCICTSCDQKFIGKDEFTRKIF